MSLEPPLGYQRMWPFVVCVLLALGLGMIGQRAALPPFRRRTKRWFGGGEDLPDLPAPAWQVNWRERGLAAVIWLTPGVVLGALLGDGVGAWWPYPLAFWIVLASTWAMHGLERLVPALTGAQVVWWVSAAGVVAAFVLVGGPPHAPHRVMFAVLGVVMYGGMAWISLLAMWGMIVSRGRGGGGGGGYRATTGSSSSWSSGSSSSSWSAGSSSSSGSSGSSSSSDWSGGGGDFGGGGASGSW